MLSPTIIQGSANGFTVNRCRFHFIRDLCVFFPRAVRYTEAGAPLEIDWGLFYAVITDFYLPPGIERERKNAYNCTGNHPDSNLTEWGNR